MFVGLRMTQLHLNCPQNSKKWGNRRFDTHSRDDRLLHTSAVLCSPLSASSAFSSESSSASNSRLPTVVQCLHLLGLPPQTSSSFAMNYDSPNPLLDFIFLKSKTSLLFHLFFSSSVYKIYFKFYLLDFVLCQPLLLQKV